MYGQSRRAPTGVLAALALAERAHCPKGGDDIIGSLSFSSSTFHYLFQKGTFLIYPNP
jgi:hypothetical protein